MKRIGENIRKYRKEQCLTQAQLAEKIGMSPTAVVNYESGYCDPPACRIPKIAWALCVTINALFEGCYED